MASHEAFDPVFWVEPVLTVVVTHHVVMRVVHDMVPVVAMGRGDAGHQSRRSGGQHDAEGGGLNERFRFDHSFPHWISGRRGCPPERYEPGIRRAREGRN